MPAELFRRVDVGYDTPLTYGGWKQAQALGAYIAQLLLLPGNPDRRKKRIIIHSSPFARCVQTAIGLSAGLAQVVPPITDTSNKSENSGTTPTGIASPYSRIVLKIDPWLGEWMTEQYFNHWVPTSLRSSDIVARARTLLTSTGEAEGIRIDVKTLSNNIPAREPQSPKDISTINALKIQSLVSARGRTYVAPTPNHAVLATDIIPKGYVAHARDACIQFDETWVGLRDGGEYGEKWSDFHQRIGAGVEAMLQWYLVHRYDENPLGSSQNNGELAGEAETIEATTEKVNESTKRLSDISLGSINESQDSDEELIVILVTHAGGCNKLLHAFTHKPVLIDFPQSSLTIAMKNTDFNGAGELDTLSKQYKVVLQASTDHLSPAARFKTIKELATANISVTRHSRSTSRSNRRTTLTTIPSAVTAPPSGLWGQSRLPDSSSTAPLSLWGQGEGQRRQPESGSISASAATFESQSGLWRSNGGPARRATLNELNTTIRK
jgi:hypothetical protein